MYLQLFFLAAGLLSTVTILPQAVAVTTTDAHLESPFSGSFESGVGLIRGWVCDASVVEVQMDGGKKWATGYGTRRDDTQEVCGDVNNGFGLTFNWNLLGDGTHNLKAFADGNEFASVNFTVTTLGVEYLTGVSGDFPAVVSRLGFMGRAPQDVTLRWSEPHQNFVIIRASGSPNNTMKALPLASPINAHLESPFEGSFESGVGLIRGWVCHAGKVEIQIDGGERWLTAHGTSRDDTAQVCGDSDNGFGLTFNWNLAGDGLHNLRAYADDIEFANVSFTVTTLGDEFVYGLNDDNNLPNFPYPGNTTVVQWSNPHQNFVITSSKNPVQAASYFLARLMDQYHNRLPVYDDVSSADNHFVMFGKIPDDDAPVSINGSWPDNPHSGATAMRFQFTGTGFGGYYFMNGVLPAGELQPKVNFGDIPNAGIDLSGATTLTFWARGETGNEVIEFFVAGVGRDADTGRPVTPFPDSSPRYPARGNTFRLSREWQPFTIDVSKLDLSYVLGGFGWVADDAHNPNGAVFYLDDIQYHLSPAALNARLNQPRFLTSFVTLPIQPNPLDANQDDDIDLVFRNLAFSYDNALALLAFLAEGSPDGLRRARLIGDTFVYASQHDRFYDDGRIRTAYAAGDIALPPGWTPNNRLGTVPVPGFYSEEQQRFYEVEQTAVDVGNNAWTMIALLALYQRTQDPSYLNAARRIGEFIQTFRNNTGTYQGFQGGLDNPESSNPSRRVYASVEHNIDVYAAFQVMAQLTGEPQWNEAAAHAQAFVEALWDASRGCFLAGTGDPQTRNAQPGQLPVDVQAWSILAGIPFAANNSLAVLGCAESNHRTQHDGFSGFDFNEDKDGVWFEGTGQMAVAYALANQPAAAAALTAELRRAQTTPPFGDGFGISAASHDGLSTGFGFKYFRRLHIGATAWFVFAQQGFNPYYQTAVSK